MIKIRIFLKKNGTINRFYAKGHSKIGIPGNNIVCASATILMRTAAKLLEEESGTVISGKADKPGNIELSVYKIPEDKILRVQGITDYLIRGLSDLSEEYPGECLLTIKTE